MIVKMLYRGFCIAEAGIAAAFLLTTVAVIFVGAVLRSIDLPVNWALDIALLLFTWGVFLGADVAFRENKFMNIEIFTAALPFRQRRILEIILLLVILVFLSALTYYGAGLTVFSWPRAFQGIPELSYSWVTMSVPICSAFMMVSTGIKLRSRISGVEEPK